jgi:SAM-dependent methyltransferase
MPCSVPLSYHASDGAAYERFLGRWSERLAKVFADFAHLPARGSVLDVGCATGGVAAEVARRVPDRNVVGVDVAEAYLDFARGRHRAPNLSFQYGDAAALPFADGTYAATLAQLVLNFVPDPLAAARQMHRVTQPGGVVAAAVWDFCGGLVFQRLFWDTAAGVDPSATIVRDRLFSHPLGLADGLPRLWASAGFSGIESASLTIRMDYRDFDDYWEPLLGGQGPVGAYAASLNTSFATDYARASAPPFCQVARMACDRLQPPLGLLAELPALFRP